MICNLVYLYLIAPLHTGDTTQEGNLFGIARESPTNLPYAPSSTDKVREDHVILVKDVILKQDPQNGEVLH